MKAKIFKHTFSIIFILFLIACSTKKDTFLARNSHALSARDNILYNGQIGLYKGIESIKSDSQDNFWKQLPIERMQIKEDNGPDEKTKNTNFELAEAKATKAIQKHSMNIDGQEKNYQIDEAYLLLGKARYYDQRFFPALDAFNYILYKYSSSSNIYQAKIWREKTNMRLGNDAQVIKNISKLLKEKKLKKQVIADANALLAESFLNLEEKDSAITKLKIAENFTKLNPEKARYRFILGQMYQELGKKDSANFWYESLINMNRKAERAFVIQAYAKKAQLFDYENGDKDAFVKTYNKLIDDRENRPFKDILFYEMGVFYDKQNNQDLAFEFYNASLKSKSTDPYLLASDYRNLGNMYFKNTDYSTAAKYYDSTLVKLDIKTREYIRIKKVRKDLDEVIAFELIAKRNDSILNVVSMSEPDRILYFEDYIAKLKKSEEAKKILEEEQKDKLANIDRNNLTTSDDPAAINKKPGSLAKKPSFTPPTGNDISGKDASNVFYFYSPSTVAFGKIEFKKKYGNRALNGNWRAAANKTDAGIDDSITDNNAALDDDAADVVVEEKYTPIYYINQLPTGKEQLDNIAKERNFTYYQLGIIYKEKFKEYELASKKLEQLLLNNPEEKMVLPTMYNLYKIYQITDSAKAAAMKNRISSQYPNSRYAQIINNVNTNAIPSIETPEDVYDKWFKLYQEEQFTEVLAKMDDLIIQYTGDEIVPKFDLLKANTIGKLRGLEAYKSAMQFVTDNYPLSEEGKNAQEILTTQIPLLEKMNFTITDTKNWKILYKVGKSDDKNTKVLTDKIKKFNTNENYQKLTYSFDIYTEKENFIVITGMKSEAYAKSVAAILEEDKKYKITEPAIVISNENYTVVQIKKNLAEYLALQKTVDVPAQPILSDPLVPEPAGDTILSADDDQDPNQVAPTTNKPDQPLTKDAETKPQGGIIDEDDPKKPNPTSTPKQ